MFECLKDSKFLKVVLKKLLKESEEHLPKGINITFSTGINAEIFGAIHERLFEGIYKKDFKIHAFFYKR